MKFKLRNSKNSFLMTSHFTTLYTVSLSFLKENCSIYIIFLIALETRVHVLFIWGCHVKLESIITPRNLTESFCTIGILSILSASSCVECKLLKCVKFVLLIFKDSLLHLNQ